MNSCRFEGCTLTGALSVTTSIREGITVIHGPSGCAHHNFSLLHSTNLDHNRIAVPHIVSSGLLDSEIVFGGEEALERAIESAISQSPKSVFVLSTCITETIGDDVIAVCGKHWDVPVIPIPTAGFLGGSFQMGVNNALKTIAGLIGVYPNNGSVNIIGEKNLEYEVEENYTEIKRLLSLLDLQVNVRFIHKISTTDIEKIGRASLNILRDAELVSVGKQLFQQFGTPFIDSFPTGFSGTITFLNQIAEIYGLQGQETITYEESLHESILDDFRDITGSSIAVDHSFMISPDYAFFHEVVKDLHIKVKPDGCLVPIPISPPIGTMGIKRMLHRWRRSIHAQM